jgi:DNA-binding beta-propeller fold protein YncE
MEHAGGGAMRLATLWVGLLVAASSAGRGETSVPLMLEEKIALGDVKGRIDHFAFDPTRRRLFVAELGNDSVGVIDLEGHRLARTLTGVREPQGLAYVPWTDTLCVASAADGSMHLFRGADLVPDGRIALDDDADNIRVDLERRRIVVGYGRGALAVIDSANRSKIADIALRAHPESFQFDDTGKRIFVNVPNAHQIAVVDVTAAKQTSSLPTAGARSNFPMAVDRDRQRVLAVFRDPPMLKVYDSRDGRPLASRATCKDADDIFVDARRRRVYVSCGEGVIDVFSSGDDAYERIARVPTVPGARTSLFVPHADRLFVAVRAASGEPAAVWIFRPTP